MPAFLSFFKNRKNLTLLFFGVLLVSLLTNIALWRRPDTLAPASQPSLGQSQNTRITELEEELRRSRQRTDFLEGQNQQLRDTLARTQFNSSTPDPSSQPTPALPTTPPAPVEPSPNPELDQNTPLSLRGEGCDFAPSANSSPQAKKCELINQETDEVIDVLIDCQAEKYLVFPAGSSGICTQGAQMIIGKRTAFEVYLVNLVTLGNTGQNLQPFGYNYRTGEINAYGTFYAAPRLEGVGEDATIRQLGADFARAYRQYVADEIPPEFFNRLYIYPE